MTAPRRASEYALQSPFLSLWGDVACHRSRCWRSAKAQRSLSGVTAARTPGFNLLFFQLSVVRPIECINRGAGASRQSGK